MKTKILKREVCSVIMYLKVCGPEFSLQRRYLKLDKVVVCAGETETGGLWD